MNFDPNLVIVDHDLARLGTKAMEGYLTHALCAGGLCRFVYNGVEHRLCRGDLMIVRLTSQVSGIVASSDLRVHAIYVAAPFIEVATPASNYGMRGQLALFNQPVMHLTDEQFEQCSRDFTEVEHRLAQVGHNFQHELVVSVLRTMILDFYDFHSAIYGNRSVSAQFGNLMARFLQLLDDRHYRRQREVSYYAGVLCVTPKYLSEVSKKVSGKPANYWINRYTALDISRQLRDKSLSIQQVCDMFNFSSQSYFIRYVQSNLGMPPTAFRE